MNPTAGVPTPKINNAAGIPVAAIAAANGVLRQQERDTGRTVVTTQDQHPGIPYHSSNGRPRLLDLGCCQGGAARGYAEAGFDVTGVDKVEQPRYPYRFVKADALEYLAEHGHEYEAVHSSMPCQGYSETWRLHGKDWPRLVAPTRLILLGLGHPCWVMENVPPAPLIDPIELCGAMFGLRTYRHRLFESNVPLTAPHHPAHTARQTKMGRPPQPGEFMHIVGNFSGVEQGRAAMGIDWMNRDGLREAIPPSFASHIGGQLLAHLSEVAA